MPNVTLRQLRMFAAVARTGAVSGAAQALNVSPPAVTMQMRLLQEQLRVALLDRSSLGTTTTQAGRRVLEAAARIETILADCSASLAGLAGGEEGAVAVGVVSTAKYFAPQTLANFSRTHPRIEMRLAIGNRADIIEGLRRHDIDIAVMGLRLKAWRRKPT